MSATQNSFAIRSKNVLTASGLTDAVLTVKNGKIVDLTPTNKVFAKYTLADGTGATQAMQVEDLGDLVVMPGLVDSHVHVNEPGRTEWEGFETATRACAAGGITTIADMPLNCDPVTTTLKALDYKLNNITGNLWIDCAFYGGVVPGNTDELEPMIKRGVVGFKCFLIHSGIDEFPNVQEADLRAALPILSQHKMPLLVHAELECAGPSGTTSWQHCGHYHSFVASRPRLWENKAVELMAGLAEEFKGPIHIVHLSSSDAIPIIKSAKQKGLPFTVETCPHYLTFAAENIPDNDPRFKCAPPIRENENREKLWQAVIDQTIDFVVSDHSPCSPELKFLAQGDLEKAWGGISSVQFGLPVIWTQAQKQGLQLADVVKCMATKPAQFLGLGKQKGLLAPGYDADIVIFSPEETFQIQKNMIHHKHKATPYDGMQLQGVVKRTYVRGNLVYDGQVHTEPHGTQLLKVHAEIKS